MPVFRSVVTLAHPSLGGVGTNTWHFRTTDAGPSSHDQLLTAAGQLDTFYAEMVQVCAGDTTAEHDGLWQEVGTETPTLETTPGWSNTQAVAADPLPPFVCAVIGWRSALSSRRGRGRTFLSPLATSDNQDNGTLVEATRAGMASQAELQIIDPFDGGADGAFCVWSVADQVGRDIVAVSVSNKFGSLRSRRD